MAAKVLIMGKKDDALFQRRRDQLEALWQREGLDPIRDITKTPDFAVVLGGDGSLLSAIRNLGEFRYQVPVLGVHMSPGLGFLHTLRYPKTSGEEEPFFSKVAELLLTKSYSIQRRWGLEASCISSQGEATVDFWSMNDIVISKSHISRILALDAKVNGNLILSNLKGDGLIVSSATGSTGYSLSAGGPVLDPLLQAMVITPVCPHRLSQRPFVLSSDSEIDIIPRPGKNTSFLTADGQSGIEVASGDRVHVRTAKSAVQWIIPNVQPGLESQSYFESLRTKIGFGGES
ncbi:MAG TPA: NAD(+)/NADH kinase [Bdellovibrionota bacterium]|jgi:NAD+ kinase|nr:NAD(+)/NADH kinase [Bdellovibrionota bacterium]